jgi:hypothetical protein
LLDVLKVESQCFRLLDLFDETSSLHFVDDLLLGLGLLDQVGVGTGTGNEFWSISAVMPGLDWTGPDQSALLRHGYL